MKVIRAKSAGFCWGVERAIQVAREEACGGRARGLHGWPADSQQADDGGLESRRHPRGDDYQSKQDLSLPEEEEGFGRGRAGRWHFASTQEVSQGVGPSFPGRHLSPAWGLSRAKSKLHAQKGLRHRNLWRSRASRGHRALGYASGRGASSQTKPISSRCPLLRGAWRWFRNRQCLRTSPKPIGHPFAEISRYARFRHYFWSHQGRTVRSCFSG